MDKTRQTYLQLLADPDIRIKPEWMEDAIVDWLNGNIERFLDENPKAYEPLIQNADIFIRARIAQHIPIVEKYEWAIKQFLRQDWPTMVRLDAKKLCARIARHGKADLIAELNPVWLKNPDWIVEYLDLMSPRALIAVVKKIKWRRTFRAAVAKVKTAFERLASSDLEELYKGDGTTPGLEIEDLPAVAIAIMLKRLPIESAEKLATAWMARSSPLTCMKCGKTCNSDAGFKIHRKQCDPDDEYPPVQEILVRRRIETVKAEATR
jgi:hypothetical protein